MKALLSICLLLLFFRIEAATSYTEWFCNSTGTNINAGSTTNATPTFSNSNQNWDSTTGIYTSTGSDLSGVSVGMWASVFVDGATTAVFVGRITAVDDTLDTITVSTTIKTGTAPSTSATGRSIVVGGAWYGPWYSGATVDNWPISTVNDRLTNTSLASPRINFKNDRVYGTTNVIQNSNGPIRFQGFATNAGDFGRAWLTGSTVGAGHAAFTFNGANVDVTDFIFATNGASANAALVTGGNNEQYFSRCVFRDSRGAGISTAGFTFLNECESFLCNANNTAGTSGFNISGASSVLVRCVAHDNVGTGTSGFIINSTCSLINCIADSNGRDGLTFNAVNMLSVEGCDFYNNGTNGINLTGASATTVLIENCNFIGNGVGLTGAYAINSSGSVLRNGSVINCVFGTGTATNGSGGANIFPGTGLNEIGNIGLAANVNPWVDAANGNFSVTNTSPTINAGRGIFMQTQSGYGGTVSYPDTGATQITNSAGGASFVSYPIFRR